MSHVPHKDLAAYLDTQLASLTLATNLFTGPLTDKPDECVALIPSPGRESQGVHSDQSHLWYPGVQVIVRSKPHDYDGGYTLARTVLTTLHRAAVSGYWDVVCRQSSPIPAGQDQRNRYLFTINLEARYAE